MKMFSLSLICLIKTHSKKTSRLLLLLLLGKTVASLLAFPMSGTEKGKLPGQEPSGKGSSTIERTAANRRAAELQERGSTFEEEKEEEKENLQEQVKEEVVVPATLEGFKKALKKWADAGRLIVVESGGDFLIEPRPISEGRFGLERSENKTTIDRIRTLISPGIVDDLLRYRSVNAPPLSMDVDPLTPQRMKEIFDRIEQHSSESVLATSSLALQRFKEAAENPNYLTADRLVIDSKTAAIRPWTKSDRQTQGKDKTIFEELQKGLLSDYKMFHPPFVKKIIEEIVCEEIPKLSLKKQLKAKVKEPSLSTKMLQQILDSAERAMVERRFVEHCMLTLQDFKNAMARFDVEGTERLIIKGEGIHAVIVPEVSDPKNKSDYRLEDNCIRTALKRALEQEGHPKKVVHELIQAELSRPAHSRLWHKISPPLSFEKLKTIIQKADEAMAEQQLLQATHSIVPLSSTATQRVARRQLLGQLIESSLRAIGVENQNLQVNISGPILRTILPKSLEEINAERDKERQQAEWEQQKCEEIFYHLICHEREPYVLRKNLEKQYKDVEAATIAAENFHYQAAEGQRAIKKKEEFLQQSESLFKEVKAALDERREQEEFSESTLTKISQVANVASVFLGMFDIPFVNAQGIADVVATIADLADKKLTIAQAAKAKEAFQTVKRAMETVELAIQGTQEIHEAANSQHGHAGKLEEGEKKQEEKRIKKLLNLVKLPIDTADEVWQEWAKQLICQSDIADAANEKEAVSFAHLLRRQGNKNPEQMYDLLVKLWKERVSMSKKEAEFSKQKISSEVKKLKEDYDIANAEEISAEEAAQAAIEKFKEAAEAKNQWLMKHDQLINEKNELYQKILASGVEQEELQAQLNKKKDELAAHQHAKLVRDMACQETTQETETLAKKAQLLHVAAFEKWKKYNSVKESRERMSARLQAAAQADQQACHDISIARADYKKTPAQKIAEEALNKSNDELVELQKPLEDKNKLTIVEPIENFFIQYAGNAYDHFKLTITNLENNRSSANMLDVEKATIAFLTPLKKVKEEAKNLGITHTHQNLELIYNVLWAGTIFHMRALRKWLWNIGNSSEQIDSIVNYRAAVQLSSLNVTAERSWIRDLVETTQNCFRLRKEWIERNGQFKYIMEVQRRL